MKTKLNLGLQHGFFRRLLLWPLVALAMSLLALAALNQSLLQPIAQKEQQIIAQERQVQTLQRQVRQLEQYRDYYQRYGQAYDDLSEQGLMQPVNRVAWTDKLNRFSQQQLISGLSLQFDAERLLSANQLERLPIETPIFYGNKLSLSGRLQTDTDFLLLIDSLRSQIMPHLWLERCDLQLMRGGVGIEVAMNPFQGNVIVRCDLQLFRAQPGLFNPQEWR